MIYVMAILGFLNLMISTFVLWGGVRLFLISRKNATITGFFALALLVSKPIFANISGLEANLFPWDAYPFVEQWWWIPFAFFLMGIGLAALWSSRWKRDLLLVCGGLLALHSVDLLLSNMFYRNLQGAIDEEGICRQTSGYSCGAAASVMFLSLHGIPATEEEMAKLSVTHRNWKGGTTEAGILRGLRKKGLICGLTSAEVPRAPALASIRLNPLVNHLLVIIEVTPDRVVVLDPLEGKRTYTPETFESKWTGTLVVEIP